MLCSKKTFKSDYKLLINKQHLHTENHLHKQSDRLNELSHL